MRRVSLLAASPPSGRRQNREGKGGKGGGGDGGGGSGGGGGGGGGGSGGGGGGGSGGLGGGDGGGGGSGSGGGGSGSGGGGSSNGGGGSGSGGGGGGGGGAGRGGAAQRGGFGGSQRQQQPRSRETPSAQQHREWYVGRWRSGGVGPCTYVLRTSGRRGETSGLPHTAHRCFGRQTDAWRAQIPDAVELPRWGDVLKQNVAIFDLDFDAILAAMYVASDSSAEGDYYLCVPPDPGIEAVALGASESAAPGTSESAAPGTMDVTRTSMIHAAAPHFLWPFAVQYDAHHINLHPRVSLPETTRALRWTGKVGDASVFCVWGSRALVRDASVDKLSSCAIPCGPASSGVSQVDHVEPFEVGVDSCAARGAEPAGAGPRGAEPGVAESEGVDRGGAEPERVEPGGAEPKGTEPGGAESGGAEPGGAEPEHAESRGPSGVPSRQEPLSLQQLREWYAWRIRRAAGATGLAAGGASGAGAARGAAGAAATGDASGAAGDALGAGAAGAAGPGGAGAGGTGTVEGPAGVGATGGAGPAGPGGARTGGTGAAGAGGAAGVGSVGAGDVPTRGAAGAGAGGAVGVVAKDPGAEGTGAVSAVSGGASRPRPYYVPLLQEVLGLPPSPGPPPLLSPPPVQSQSQFQPASPLPGPSPYSGPTTGITERCEPESRPASPESRPALPESRTESPVCAVHTGHRVPHQRPPPVLGTHSMTLRPSTAPQRVPLPSPPASSLPALTDPENISLRTASPTITGLLATVVIDPSFESTAASALVAELVDFAAHCHLDYTASLVAECASVCPPSVEGECALGSDVFQDRQEEFECFAAAVPHLVSMLLALEGDPDAPDIPTPCSYAEAIEGPYSSQWQAAMDAEMASWKSTGTYVDEVPPPRANIINGMWIFRVKRPPGSPPVFKARYVARGFNLDELTSYLGLRITRDRAQRTITLTQSHMVQQVLQCFGFTYSLPQSTPPPTGHSLSAPPSDESMEPSGPYPELVGCLMYLMTCTRPDLAYPLSLLARYVAPGRHQKVQWDAAKRVLRYLCSMLGMGLVLGGQARVVLTGHAVASWVDDLAT
ncbi:unnamed protein product [Closterium sp. NIES-54]